MSLEPLRVLLVDDDEDDYIIARDLLAEIGGADITLEWVDSYAGGLEAMVLNEHDVYLVDHRLGGGESGLDLMKEAIASGCAVPVIMLTGTEDYEIDLEAMRAGGADYLVKGHIDSHQLERSIRYAVERRRIADEKARLEAQILTTQKLESLGVLAGGIAHDFSNLLHGVLGYAAIALDQLGEGSPAWDAICAIQENASRASDLTGQMLAYSGQGHLLVAPVDLAEIFEAMRPLLESVISKKAALRFDFNGRRPRFEGDPDQVRQVIVNLVGNASDALGDRPGTIEIRVTRRHVDRATLAGTFLDDNLPDGEYVVLEVADDGCGMDEPVRARVFDPFFTTHVRARGLGLAAVLGIVRGHRGAIRLDSEPGEGTTVTVLLPVTEGAVEPAPEPPTEPSPCGDIHDPHTVLIVDDEPAVLEVGRITLEKHGCRVLAAPHGLRAVEMFREHAGAICVVVMDISMPEMNGIEAFRAIREIQPDARVVLSSGYAEEDALRGRRVEGVAAYLQKPYLPHELMKTLREVVGAAP